MAIRAVEDLSDLPLVGQTRPRKSKAIAKRPRVSTPSRADTNPNSNYYLAFNTGYPNAYDRAWGYTAPS